MNTQTPAPSNQQIIDWIVAWLAEETGIPAAEIDPAESPLTYSTSSISATILAGDLEDWLGVTLDPTLAWDHPSIEAIVDHLATALAPAKPA